MLVASDGVRWWRPAPGPAGRPASRAPWTRLPVAAVLGAAAACSGTPRIAIAAPQARLSPPLLGACAVFMTIENAGDGDDALLSAAVDVPGAVAELHGVSEGRMVKRDRVPIPARGSVELKPGGVHVMVFRLPKDAGAGYQFTVRLAFQKAGEKVASVRISG